jgi:type 1 fimbriae regulatory protein FimB
MKSFTKEQFASLLKVAKVHSADDYLALLLGFHHGLRVSEILALGAENVVEGRLVVQRLKGSKKTTQMLLSPAKELVEVLVASGQEKFFHICRKTFWLHMKQYAAEAGIPQCNPHMLKHSCGRLAYLGGMGVAEVGARLGHKNLGNSLIYMQASDEEADKAFARAVGL